MRFTLPLVLLAIGCSSTEAPAAFEANGGSRAAESADDDASPREGRSARPPSRVPTDTSGVTPSAPESAPKSPTSWRGRLDTSPAVDFGGGKWCNYQVVLSDIELTLTLDPDGRIVASDITNTMTETATSCEAQPLGVQRNTYVFRKPDDGALGSLTVRAAPDPNNLPQANVMIVGERIDATHMRARVLFHRTGAVDEVLNWRDAVDVDLTLAPNDG